MSTNEYYWLYFLFLSSTTSSQFCRDSARSLVAAYNNGALPCDCDKSGSTGAACDPVGGQCPCRQFVIGRQCTKCATGYYGFPYCRCKSAFSFGRETLYLFCCFLTVCIIIFYWSVYVFLEQHVNAVDGCVMRWQDAVSALLKLLNHLVTYVSIRPLAITHYWAVRDVSVLQMALKPMLELTVTGSLDSAGQKH